MKLLLDSSVFLWLNNRQRTLPEATLELLEDPENDRLLSVASCWELAIKHASGKLNLPASPDVWFPARIDALATDLLPIKAEHVYLAAALPFHHRDPFDRLLVAQSIIEKMPIVTADIRLAAYGVEILPA